MLTGGLSRHDGNRFLFAILLHRGVERCRRTGTMIDREAAAFIWILIFRLKLDKSSVSSNGFLVWSLCPRCRIMLMQSCFKFSRPDVRLLSHFLAYYCHDLKYISLCLVENYYPSEMYSPFHYRLLFFIIWIISYTAPLFLPKYTLNVVEFIQERNSSLS